MNVRNGLIYDIGMNNGDDTAYYLARGNNVIAIEADPDLADAAQKRFAEAVKDGRLLILNVGIADRAGTMPFWICEGKSEWSSFDKNIASRLGKRCHSVIVKCLPFGEIIREHGLGQYMKIDIEGNDEDCLSCFQSQDLPGYISLELSSEGILDQLNAIGFQSFKIIIQNNHRALQRGSPGPTRWLRRRLPLYLRSLRYRLGFRTYTRKMPFPLSGYAIPQGGQRPVWAFPYGSSGPFGEETDGVWLAFDEVKALWKDYLTGRTEYGRPSLALWLDIHARSR